LGVEVYSFQNSLLVNFYLFFKTIIYKQKVLKGKF
jgi:hypothetical protein